MSEFPKRLFARFNEAGTASEFLETSDSTEESLDAIPVGQEAVVAEYELVAVKRYKAQVVECGDDTATLEAISK